MGSLQEIAHLGLERGKGAPRRRSGVQVGRSARKGASGRGNSEGKGWAMGLMGGVELWFGVMSRGREV